LTIGTTCWGAESLESTIATLKTINDPYRFLENLPERNRKKFQSYTDNILVKVVPPALEDKSQKIKNDVLEAALKTMRIAYNYRQEGYVRALIVAVIQAGANPNLESKEYDVPLFHSSYDGDDIEYARTLIDLGANSWTYVGDFRRIPLFFIAQTPELAELFLENGADVGECQLGNNAAVLHEVAMSYRKAPELLELYLSKYRLNIHAQTKDNKTALDQLLNYRAYYEAGEKDIPKFIKKLKILLKHDAQYLNGLEYIQKELQREEIEETGVFETTKSAHGILTQHHDSLEPYRQEAARLRDICID